MCRVLTLVLVASAVGCMRPPSNDAPAPMKPIVEAPPVSPAPKPEVAPPASQIAAISAQPEKSKPAAVAPVPPPAGKSRKPEVASKHPAAKPAAELKPPTPMPIKPPVKPIVAAIDKSPQRKPIEKRSSTPEESGPMQPRVKAKATHPTTMRDSSRASREKKPVLTPDKAKLTVVKSKPEKSARRDRVPVRPDPLVALDRTSERAPGQSPFTDAKPVVKPAEAAPRKVEPALVKNGGKLVRSSDVFELYRRDEKAGDGKFGGIVNIGGQVNRVARGQVTLVERGDRDGTRCNFRDAGSASELKEGDRVLIRGRCVGMTFGTLVLEDCELIKRIDSELEYSRLFGSR